MPPTSERLATFPEQNPDPVLEAGPEGELQYLNPAAREAFPGAPDDPDHPVRARLPSVYRRLVRTDLRREKRIVQVGDRTYDQYVCLAKDELTLRIYMFERHVPEGARAEQRSMQAFYARVLRDLPTEVAVLDPDGRYLYINPAAVGDPELREWLIGRTTKDYARYRDVDPEPFERRHEWILEVARSRETGRLEETIETRGGEERHFLRIMHPVIDEDGEVRRLVGYGLDLTDRKRFEDELRRAKEEAERASGLKTAMLANMSHEVRTPLTSIIGFAEMIADGSAENTRKFARLIERSGRRLLETLDSVLDLSQIEAGEAVLRQERLDLTRPVRETVQMLGPQASERGLTFETDLPERPIWVRGDFDAIGRITANLVSNALKFTDRGSVTVRVYENEHRACLEVEDTGVGIEADFVDELFTAFRQESTGMRREYEGVGLGLTIVRELVDLQDGRIDVESEKGRGSRFRVQLPLAGAEDTG